MRKSYERGELDEGGASDDPVHQFRHWFDKALASGVPEPNAMTLATVDADGRPSTRIVLVKSFDADGLVWYTNYRSRKGHDLEVHPFAALQFHWVELERVVRIEGPVEKVSPEQSDDYFQLRPLDSRIGAWASPQSEVIPSRATLLANAATASARFGPRPPRPEWWGGYRLRPQLWEFWQGRRSRLHDRLRYRLVDDHWLRERLAP